MLITLGPEGRLIIEVVMAVAEPKNAVIDTQTTAVAFFDSVQRLEFLLPQESQVAFGVSADAA